MSLQPHEIRVIQEQADLEDKLSKLADFLDKGKPTYIDQINWDLLSKQYGHMSDYNEVLKQRISFFGVN